MYTYIWSTRCSESTYTDLYRVYIYCAIWATRSSIRSRRRSVLKYLDLQIIRFPHIIRGLPWKLVWNLRALPWNFAEILGVVILSSPISSVWSNVLRDLSNAYRVYIHCAVWATRPSIHIWANMLHELSNASDVNRVYIHDAIWATRPSIHIWANALRDPSNASVVRRVYIHCALWATRPSICMCAYVLRDLSNA